ncbi:MAG: CDP-alcohol phosphatidyltransferase family protein [Candidatus Kerfeldbacteria bacterium]
MKVNKIKSTIPNALSVIRFLCGCSVIVLYFIPHPILAVQILVLSGIVSDKLDGTLARFWKTESELGKKLESVIDPFFVTASLLYVLIFLDFPVLVAIIAGIMAAIPNVGRLYIKLRTGEFFYEKSQITRYGVGLAFILAVLYLFSVPYRDWVAWGLLLYGVVATVNYLKMMAAYMKKKKSTPAAEHIKKDKEE